MISNDSLDWIRKMPKVELHLHLDGTLEPELLWKIANRNNISLGHNSIEEIRDSFNFHSLSQFIDIFTKGMSVLIHEIDFYELTMSYMERAHENCIRHVEPFLDIQGHLCRNISMDVIMSGVTRALKDAKTKFGISSLLIINFVRDMSAENAMEVFEKCMAHKDSITAFGISSCELHNPPAKFKDIFVKANKEGFRLTAHAGEEGPPGYITEAIEILKVQRIDHGVRCLESEQVIGMLKQTRIPLTVCPLSNIALKVFPSLKEFPIHQLISHGLLITINSDDPAYFGGYLNKNFIDLFEISGVSKKDIFQLGRNGITASFLKDEEKMKLYEEFDNYIKIHDTK